MAVSGVIHRSPLFPHSHLSPRSGTRHFINLFFVCRNNRRHFPHLLVGFRGVLRCRSTRSRRKRWLGLGGHRHQGGHNFLGCSGHHFKPTWGWFRHTHGRRSSHRYTRCRQSHARARRIRHVLRGDRRHVCLRGGCLRHIKNCCVKTTVSAKPLIFELWLPTVRAIHHISHSGDVDSSFAVGSGGSGSSGDSRRSRAHCFVRF